MVRQVQGSMADSGNIIAEATVLRMPRLTLR